MPFDGVPIVVSPLLTAALGASLARSHPGITGNPKAARHDAIMGHAGAVGTGTNVVPYDRQRSRW
jgi:hypothetical protein